MNSERHILKRLLEGKVDYEEPTEDLDERTYTIGGKQYWKRDGKCYCWSQSDGKKECSEEEYMKAISSDSDSVKNTEPKNDKAKEDKISVAEKHRRYKEMEYSKYSPEDFDKEIDKREKELESILDDFNSIDYVEDEEELEEYQAKVDDILQDLDYMEKFISDEQWSRIQDITDKYYELDYKGEYAPMDKWSYNGVKQSDFI